jgi:hypothetical protein
MLVARRGAATGDGTSAETPAPKPDGPAGLQVDSWYLMDDGVVQFIGRDKQGHLLWKRPDSKQTAPVAQRRPSPDLSLGEAAPSAAGIPAMSRHPGFVYRPPRAPQGLNRRGILAAQRKARLPAPEVQPTEFTDRVAHFRRQRKPNGLLSGRRGPIPDSKISVTRQQAVRGDTSARRMLMEWFKLGLVSEMAADWRTDWVPAQ